VDPGILLKIGSSAPFGCAGWRADDGSVGLGLFAREWERTCSECGYTWRVSLSIARRGIRGMSAMTVRGATAGPMHDTNRGSVGALSADIEARAELMEGYGVCAKCGADNFTQRPCRRSETATVDLPPPAP
jgi:predicted nucleic-acid-binding Zn-ribbon protein